MSQLPLYKLALDKTGVNPDNLQVDEPHDLAEGRFRAVCADYGAFFVKGTILKDALTQRVLDLGADYHFIKLEQTLTLLFVQEVVGVAIITNPEVSSRVLMTYQAVGDHFSHNNESLVSLLESPVGQQTSKSYLDVMNKLESMVPVPHIHDIGDGLGFEFLVYAIERLRSAIVWKDMSIINALVERIDRALADLANVARYRLDTELAQYLLDYRQNFTKEVLGLGKVVNMGIATEDQGRFAARPDFNLGTDVNDRYVTIKSLISFKQELVSRMVSMDTTYLGKSFGFILQPRLDAYASLPNGARVIIDSLESVSVMSMAFDREAYPDLDEAAALHRFAITKVTNNPSDHGGVFQGFNMATAETYTGVLKIAAGKYTMTWKRMMTQADSNAAMTSLAKHISNQKNPHGLRKDHVDLGNVMNYGIVTDADIFSRVPKDLYMTHAAFMVFVNALLTEKWKLDGGGKELTPEEKARNLRAYQNLFMPCGSCDDGQDNLTLTTGPTATRAPVEIRGIEKGYNCMGYTKVVTYADGLGGTFIKTFENSEDCNYKTSKAGYELRDLTGTKVLGYGYAQGEPRDAEANVAVTGPDGDILGYIFPDAAQGRQAQIRNFSGDLIGFAINP